MNDRNHTFNKIKPCRNCSYENFTSAKTLSQQTRSHCISIRLNDAELSYVDSLRKDLNRAVWIRMSALKYLPPKIPEINLTVWKELAKASQNLNNLIQHLDTKSHNSPFTFTEIYTVQKRIKVLRDTLLSATRSVSDKQ
ncbi:hypothetical protein JMY81_23705 [Brenneria goodwinii]|uniref:hypothetical protein n=1 Tax=Brenneria goodwinii TaxID=1109412 RepID=UPI000EF18A59|nr:hypothetical protein [Brenneria goodwinii]MCG8159185.1 hypothetical protein [Brenneria goodwinii]MCG8163795.1 hypothetical protein [Brenneria goodwinii]MCG8168410.1 hypothetical protein [Brenneria goodwinii]MCG8173023.1 hypothetical protein [Brenneria goodwinii]MCG8177680.1 hypothetical protein [Brenneria goodwinii]